MTKADAAISAMPPFTAIDQRIDAIVDQIQRTPEFAAFSRQASGVKRGWIRGGITGHDAGDEINPTQMFSLIPFRGYVAWRLLDTGGFDSVASALGVDINQPSIRTAIEGLAKAKYGSRIKDKDVLANAMGADMIGQLLFVDDADPVRQRSALERHATLPECIVPLETRAPSDPEIRTNPEYIAALRRWSEIVTTHADKALAVGGPARG